MKSSLTHRTQATKERRFSITHRQGTFDVIHEDEPLSENLSDYYEVAPEKLEVIGLPPEETVHKKDRSLSLGALAGSLNFLKIFSK